MFGANKGYNVFLLQGLHIILAGSTAPLEVNKVLISFKVWTLKPQHCLVPVSEYRI